MDTITGATKALPLIEAVSARLSSLLGGYETIIGELEHVNNRARCGSDLLDAPHNKEAGTPARSGHIGRLEDLADRLDALNGRLKNTVQSLAELF